MKPPSLVFSWSALARLGGLAPEEGSGGELRAVPADFVVDEIPLYAPSGDGEYLFVRFKKTGHNTGHVLQRLGKALRLRPNQIGHAGQKDRHAVTTQWISLPAKAERWLPGLELWSETGFELLEMARHHAPIGLGHLRGNRFCIRVRNASSAGMEARLRQLEQFGVPNYFGPQRFGLGGLNAEEGLRVLRGESKLTDKALRRFLVTAVQSAVFNRFVSLRLEAGLLDAVLAGDHPVKHETGGVFWAEDAEEETRRAMAGLVSAQGNMWGKKSAPLRGDAAVLEAQALRDMGLSPDDFHLLRGDLRAIRFFFLESPELRTTEDGYTVQMSLPRGSFATAALRELTGGNIDEIPLPQERDHEFRL